MTEELVDTRRRLFAAEVIQTSAMDCGPAVLKCLLEGFGISASYGRLREACQTDVDGSSLDTLADVAQRLGLVVEERIVPRRDLALDEAVVLPAIAVTTLPTGSLHFVVIWRRFGPWFQLMDPGSGRRWVRFEDLIRELYIHQDRIPAAEWREWAGDEAFTEVLEARLAELGAVDRLRPSITPALIDPGWRELARVDGVTRMVHSLVERKAIRPGEEAAAAVELYLQAARDGWELPPGTAMATEAPPAEDGTETVFVQGAVLACVHGRRSGGSGTAEGRDDHLEQDDEPAAEPSEAEAGEQDAAANEPRLTPELEAILREPPVHPARHLLRLGGRDGILRPGILMAAVLLGAVGVVVEAMLFRGLLDVGRELGIRYQRMGAVALILCFLVGLLLLEIPVHAGARWLGRHLETRLRLELFQKLPRIGDRYFQSRLTSDMAERSHTIQAVREVPVIAVLVLRTVAALVVTTAGLVWLAPGNAGAILAAAGLAVLVPLLAHPLLSERELRVRTHAAGLARFYLDSLLGLLPARTHGSERSIRREHEHLLTQWTRSGRSFLRSIALTEGLVAGTGALAVVWIVLGYFSQPIDRTGATLLVVYWALSIPYLGHLLAVAARQYPSQRNRVLRLLEPLGTPEDGLGAADDTPFPAPRRAGGVAIQLADVHVHAGGHPVLRAVDLEVQAGEHVAVVGPSGAGKSSLIHVLLGLHRPARGEVRMDGALLEGATAASSRQQTAWIDPAVHLWNRPLLDNLLYGSEVGAARPTIAEVVERADLRDLLIDLPEGLQTSLGEGGGLVSGGEGQRVRIARGLARGGVRLALLDEAFRGLDHDQRRELLRRVRRAWRSCTMLCATHDIEDALEFDRVLVVREGTIVEDGDPRALLDDPGSIYREMVEADRRVHRSIWGSSSWRRLLVHDGDVRVIGDPADSEDRGVRRP